MIPIRTFSRIIEEIGNEENILVEQFSDDWIIKLTKNGMTKFIIGYKFDINTSCTSDICNDKYALFSILENSAIPIIKHNILFKNDEEKLRRVFRENNRDVVIKPNNGTCGNNVYHIKSETEAINIYNKLIKSEGNICVCPFYDIKSEFRAIFLNNEVEYTYKKVKPIVIGNGKENIKQLLLKFNRNYYQKESNLKNNKYNSNYVPSPGEKIEYEWRFNLSKGAKIEESTQEEQNLISEIAKKIAKEINLKFGSIDIIQTYNDEYKVIEVNSGVMMENLINLKSDGFSKAKEIYKKAINLMFE